MTNCITQCRREARPIDAQPPGVIDDDELICRGAFESNYDSKGYIKPNLITVGKLLNRELSIYRASGKANFTVEDVAIQLKRTNSSSLREIYGATASQIREIKLDWIPGRLFCVVDDTVIDNRGNKHPAHGAIWICEHVSPNLTVDDERLKGLRDHLYLQFKQNPIWSERGNKSG